MPPAGPASQLIFKNNILWLDLAGFTWISLDLAGFPVLLIQVCRAPSFLCAVCGDIYF
jgi:hypothetical protein